MIADMNAAEKLTKEAATLSAEAEKAEKEAAAKLAYAVAAKMKERAATAVEIAKDANRKLGPTKRFIK